MILIVHRRVVAISAFFWIICGSHALAQLPLLNEKNWSGYYVGFTNKKFQFGITAEGRGTLKIMGENGLPLGANKTVLVKIIVEELLPNGGVKIRAVRPGTFHAMAAAALNPKNAAFSGSVQGDATFEIMVEEDRGIIYLGGEMKNTGKITNPLRLSLLVTIPSAYKDLKGTPDKDKIKAHEDKIKDDELTLQLKDGERTKHPTAEPIDASLLNGVGISGMQLELQAYRERKILVNATPGSVLAISNRRVAPLHSGFMIRWNADSNGKAGEKVRLALQIK